MSREEKLCEDALTDYVISSQEIPVSRTSEFEDILPHRHEFSFIAGGHPQLL